jgi:hypothetical protein
MKIRQLIILGIAASLSTVSVFAAEEVSVQYEYGEDHGIDFSSMKGSFSVGAFTDDRDVDDGKLITDNDLGSGNGGFIAEEELSVMIQDALVQGFTSGGAELASADADMSVSGSVVSTEAQIIERDGAQLLQLTIRASVQLIAGGRTAFQTTLFGRGRVPLDEGMAVAVRASLDRMIRELVSDDYFLQEVL